MKKEPTPTPGQDGPCLSATDTPSSKPIILLLGVSAALLFGVGSLLLDEQQVLTPTPATNNTIVTIEGKSELQLRADLVRVNQELAQAKAEREATLKSIDQITSQLEQQLKAASLTLDE